MTATQRRSRVPADPSAALRDLWDRILSLHLETMEAIVPARADETARQWLSRMTRHLDDDEADIVSAEAIVFAVDVETLTPSLKGTTALDRVARQKGLDRARDPAFEALKRARFVPFLLHARQDDDLWKAENLVTDQRFSLFDDQIPEGAVGIPLIGRICPLEGDVFAFAGPLTPLDDAALSVAMEFVRPGRGITSDHRCAAAVYRHLSRTPYRKPARRVRFSSLSQPFSRASRPSPTRLVRSRRRTIMSLISLVTSVGLPHSVKPGPVRQVKG